MDTARKSKKGKLVGTLLAVTLIALTVFTGSAVYAGESSRGESQPFGESAVREKAIDDIADSEKDGNDAEKLPCDIYKDENGMPVPFPESITVTYDGNTKLNQKLELYKALTKTDAQILYESDNPKVASVSAQGYVTAKSAGTATIKIYANETEQYQAAEPALITLTIQKGTRSITGTKSYTRTLGTDRFKIQVKADDFGKVMYKSGNPKIAAVSSTGLVTMKLPGRVTITSTAAGNDLYKSSVHKTTVNIKPKRVVMNKPTSSGKGKLKVSWKKAANVSGYQITYAKDADFTNAGTAYVSSSASNKTFSGLYQGTRYYAKVRAYKLIDGTKYFGKYSYYKSGVTKGTALYKRVANKKYSSKAQYGEEYVEILFGKASEGKIKLRLIDSFYGTGAIIWSNVMTGTVSGNTINFKMNKWIYLGDGGLSSTAERISGVITLTAENKIKMKIISRDAGYSDLLYTGKINALTYSGTMKQEKAQGHPWCW